MDSVDIDELIHIQTSKIGLVAAEISRTLASPELTTRASIDKLTQGLEIWQSELPVVLHMATLTSDHSPDLSLYQRRALFMIHVCVGSHREKLYSGLTFAVDNVSWSNRIALPDTPRCRCGDSAYRRCSLESRFDNRRCQTV